MAEPILEKLLKQQSLTSDYLNEAQREKELQKISDGNDILKNIQNAEDVIIEKYKDLKNSSKDLYEYQLMLYENLISAIVGRYYSLLIKDAVNKIVLINDCYNCLVASLQTKSGESVSITEIYNNLKYAVMTKMLSTEDVYLKNISDIISLIKNFNDKYYKTFLNAYNILKSNLTEEKEYVFKNFLENIQELSNLTFKNSDDTNTASIIINRLLSSANELKNYFEPKTSVLVSNIKKLIYDTDNTYNEIESYRQKNDSKYSETYSAVYNNETELKVQETITSNGATDYLTNYTSSIGTIYSKLLEMETEQTTITYDDLLSESEMQCQETLNLIVAISNNIIKINDILRNYGILFNYENEYLGYIENALTCASKKLVNVGALENESLINNTAINDLSKSLIGKSVNELISELNTDSINYTPFGGSIKKSTQGILRQYPDWKKNVKKYYNDGAINIPTVYLACEIGINNLPADDEAIPALRLLLASAILSSYRKKTIINQRDVSNIFEYIEDLDKKNLSIEIKASYETISPILTQKIPEFLVLNYYDIDSVLNNASSTDLVKLNTFMKYSIIKYIFQKNLPIGIMDRIEELDEILSKLPVNFKLVLIRNNYLKVLNEIKSNYSNSILDVNKNIEIIQSLIDKYSLLNDEKIITEYINVWKFKYYTEEFSNDYGLIYMCGNDFVNFLFETASDYSVVDITRDNISVEFKNTIEDFLATWNIVNKVL